MVEAGSRQVANAIVKAWLILKSMFSNFNVMNSTGRRKNIAAIWKNGYVSVKLSSIQT